MTSFLSDIFVESNHLTLGIVVVFLLSGIVVFFTREKIGIPLAVLGYKSLYYPLKMWCIWIIRFFILIILWFFILFSLLEKSPQKEEEEKSRKSLVIVLDISPSMKTDDVKPNRLEKSKKMIQEFLDVRPWWEVWYIVFSGKAFVLSPLTSDREWILSLIERSSTDLIDTSKKWTSGTNIGDALLLANTLLEKKEWEKIILLATDGRANIGIDPTLVSRESKKESIQIWTMPVGSLSGWVLSYQDAQWVRQYFYDDTGNKLSADIDEELLSLLSQETGWIFLTGTFSREGYLSWTTLSDQSTQQNTRKNDWFLPFLLLVLIGLCWLHILLEISLWKVSMK